MQITDLNNIPFDISVLASIYNISAIANKAAELEKSGEIIRLKKGMYIYGKSNDLYSNDLIANHLYGPSYVSCQTALRKYGLIPERINCTQSITIKHSKSFENQIGRFEYIKTSFDLFHIGIKIENYKNISYLIASPEKALYDFLITSNTSDLRFKHQLYTFLEEDLRFDMNFFHQMDKSIFEQCNQFGNKKQLINNLIKLI